MRRLLLGVCAILVLSAHAARADILIYPLAGTRLAFVLQGKVTVNPGGTLSFQHARFGSLHFRLEQKIRFHRVPTTRTIANRRLHKALSEEDADQCLEAGKWALHHALLPEFAKAVSAAAKLAPDHPTVKRLASLKQKMDAPLPVSAEQEQEMRDYIAAGQRMKVVRSKHFVLLHDTPPTKIGRAKTTRAEQRLELLENVYESFLTKFYLEGYELDVPREHLMVVLFGQKKDYSDYIERLKPHLSKAAGFYDRKANIAVFFDQGTNEVYVAIEKLNRVLQEAKQDAMKKRSPNAAEIRRLADSLQILTEVAKENSDIEVVSHETTHSLAANTGLMPGNAAVPLWAAEGLATYFEAPNDAAWSGIGAVNKERLEWSRAIIDDREHSSIDFLISDQIFTRAASDGAIAVAYGQSWALTHFLMERHFDKLVEFYLLTAQQPMLEEPSEEVAFALSFFPELPPQESVDLEKQFVESFKQVFGDYNTGLNVQWRAYMRSLKTDLEVILGEE